MNNVAVEIVETDILPPRFRYRPESPWPRRTLGVLITVLVHVLVSTPLVLGYAARERRSQPATGPGSVAWVSRGEQVESMILLDLSAVSASSAVDTPEPRIESQGIAPDEQWLEIVSVDPSPPPELKFEEAADADQANPESGDPAANAALFGRYMGHVAARIERAWMRPRTPIEGGNFACKARITQDRDGNVFTVALDPCDADVRWRNSLEAAIRRSTPISSPPEPWLFTSTITLAFSAPQYSGGVTPEFLYEPAARRLAQLPAATSSGIAPITEPGDYELTNTESGVVLRRRISAAKDQ